MRTYIVHYGVLQCISGKVEPTVQMMK